MNHTQTDAALARFFSVALFCALAAPQVALAQIAIVEVPAGVTPTALNVPAGTTTTLQLPPDGKLYFSSITIGSGSVLRFTRNALNTPVYLLSTGDVVDNGGTIDIRGSNGTATAGGVGGPGGFDGGEPAFGSQPAGAGRGPGGGSPGNAANHSSGPNAYGTALAVPLMGGSGGGGVLGRGGGGGSGALLIASNTLIVAGQVYAMATGDPSGSAGTVRLVAPRVSSAGANLFVTGPTALQSGRCRVDTIDRRALNLGCSGSALVVGSFLQVEPPVVPRLDLLEVAGRTVPGGSAFVTTLPAGTASTQPVRIRAQDFGSGAARVRVRVTPYSGPAVTSAPFTIANNTDAVVNVELPPNNTVTIEVYGEETTP